MFSIHNESHISIHWIKRDLKCCIFNSTNDSQIIILSAILVKFLTNETSTTCTKCFTTYISITNETTFLINKDPKQIQHQRNHLFLNEQETLQLELNCLCLESSDLPTRTISLNECASVHVHL